MSIFTQSVSSYRTEISTNDLDDMQLKYTFDKSVDAAHKPALERELKGDLPWVVGVFLSFQG